MAADPSGGNQGNWSVQKKLGFFTLVLGVLLGIPVVAYVFPTVSHQGYMPTQPIAYSHKLHAGELKMDCKYCHVNVEKGPHASVPAVQVCMNCHRVVKTDSPEVQKIWEHCKPDDQFNCTSNTPIEWVRIHELPDHAKFNHRPHIAKGISCQQCHGPIQDMEVVYQAKPLTMGFCLECHRGQTTPAALVEAIHPGLSAEEAKGKPVAPFNCAVCHY